MDFEQVGRHTKALALVRPLAGRRFAAGLLTFLLWLVPQTSVQAQTYFIIGREGRYEGEVAGSTQAAFAQAAQQPAEPMTPQQRMEFTKRLAEEAAKRNAQNNATKPRIRLGLSKRAERTWNLEVHFTDFPAGVSLSDFTTRLEQSSSGKAPRFSAVSDDIANVSGEVTATTMFVTRLALNSSGEPQCLQLFLSALDNSEIEAFVWLTDQRAHRTSG
jgi:hypothetical protein